MTLVTPLEESKKPELVSAGFSLWKDREVRLGRTLKLEGIAKEVGLAPMTVRRFCAVPGADVSSATLGAAARLARYFGVPLDTLVHEASSVQTLSIAGAATRNGAAAAASHRPDTALLHGSSE